jgi:hypothetical protein
MKSSFFSLNACIILTANRNNPPVSREEGESMCEGEGEREGRGRREEDSYCLEPFGGIPLQLDNSFYLSSRCQTLVLCATISSHLRGDSVRRMRGERKGRGRQIKELRETHQGKHLQQFHY